MSIYIHAHTYTHCIALHHIARYPMYWRAYDPNFCGRRKCPAKVAQPLPTLAASGAFYDAVMATPDDEGGKQEEGEEEQEEEGKSVASVMAGGGYVSAVSHM